MPHSIRQLLTYCAALISGALASSVVMAAIDLVWLVFFPFVFAAALAHALFLGLPLFLFLHAKNCVNMLSSFASGFAVGSIPIALLTLQETATGFVVRGVVLVDDGVRTPAGWTNYFQSVLVDGLAGAAGALVFWQVWKSIVHVNSEAPSLDSHGRDSRP